jgi:hypothetical protein
MHIYIIIVRNKCLTGLESWGSFVCTNIYERPLASEVVGGGVIGSIGSPPPPTLPPRLGGWVPWGLAVATLPPPPHTHTPGVGGPVGSESGRYNPTEPPPLPRPLKYYIALEYNFPVRMITKVDKLWGTHVASVTCP